LLFYVIIKVVKLKMKILVISHMYPSSFNNTNGIFVHKQVKALIEQGYEVKVISPVPFAPFPLGMINEKWRAYADIPERAIIEGVEVEYPRYIEFPNSYFFEYSSYLMYLGIRSVVNSIYKDFKFDIIHSHVAFPDGFASTLINELYKVPHVVTIHGQDLQYTIFKNNKCKSRVFDVLNKVDKIITVSSKLKNVVKREVFFKNVVVINNGIDLRDYIKPMDINEQDINENMIILSVSNLIETKGIDLNIKAISRLVKSYSNIRYFIIGDGPEKKKLIKLVESLKLNDYVFFLGRLPHNEVIQYMYKSKVFSLPSWQEGFGIVYIESMACGKPVIAVKGEGIEDVIIDGKNGFLVKPQNVEDLTEKIDYILGHPSQTSLVAAEGKKNIVENYTWTINAIKTIEVYNQILNKNY
jgi:teichuronic acid biosynthesis glycosyltransferase TuaC